jgi:fibronectin type 3 domain-containing protein
MAPMQTSRLYHSTALLLPDARVLVAGGGALPGSAIDQDSAEVYSPPYLFKGARPSITSAPTTVQYTSTFQVGTPDAARIASVGLVRTPAVTHAFDQNQRYVPLTFTATAGALNVKAPANGNIAPPGYYMLFVVDTNGVPSVASFVRLPAPWEDSVAPSAPSGLSAAGGVGSIGLMWTAAVDNAAVTGYDVHRSTTPAFTPSAANRVGQTALTSFTDTGLASGTYYYLVVARDAAGNTSPPSNVAFASATGDVVPPTVSITAPSAGASVTGVVAVSAGASDNVALAGVRFLADGVAIGAEDTNAPYSVDWNTRAVANGVRSLTAVARDAAGNTTTSVAVAVNVANTGSAGLVAAYAFDADAGASVPDSSGTGNVGTISGAVWTEAGRFGGALSFGGMRDWVTVPDAPSLDLTDSMTLEAWVRPVALGGIWRTVFIKEQPGDLVYALYAGTDTSVPDGVTFTNGAEQQALGSAQIPLNAWTHLATTYDGATLRLYVNGALAGSTAASGPMPDSDGPLRIGGNAVWGEYFDGLIDELRIYSRALSATEIQGDMNAPVTPPPPPPPPADSAPPTAPTALVANGSLRTVSLSWNASTDDVGVARYNLHRSTTPGFVPSAANRVAQLTGTSYVDAGLVPGVYHYRVTAEDGAGNVSTPSAEATGNASDTSPPSAPAGVTATGSLGAVNLSWTASTDDVGVVHYNVHRSSVSEFVPDASNVIAQPTGTSYPDSALTPGVYYYLVTAADAAGNVSAPSAQASGIAAADTSPPTEPGAPSATGSFGTVKLAWSASSDDVGVVRYNVHRSTTPGFGPDASNVVAQPTGTSYTDAGLAPDVYYYVLTAEDAAGNVSAPSAELTADAVTDNSPPSAPAGLSASGSLGAVSLSWSASTDDVGVVRYNVHRSTAPAFVPDASNLVAQPTDTSYTDAPLAPGIYYYVVAAEDARGNVSTPSSEATGNASDTSAPSAPAGLSTTVSLSAISLAWTASSDDVGVVGYSVHRSKTPGFVPTAANRIAQPTEASYTDDALVPGTYYYRVTADDAAGNVSAASDEATGTVDDTSAPSAPGDVSATGSIGAVSLAWNASTDDVGVVRYSVYRSTAPGFVPEDSNLVAQPTVTSYADAGLAPGVYYYVVVGEDAAGNVSVPSAEAAGIAAADTTAPSAPSGLSATGSFGSVRLVWSTSSDDVGVSRYNVHRSTEPGFVPAETNLVAQPAGASYTDTGLVPGTYHYIVTAEDAAGNVSTPSAEVTGIAGDLAAPVVALLSPAVGSTVAGTTAVSASASDNVSVTGVQFKLDGANLGTQDTVAPYSVIWDTRQTLDGPHQLTAVARDAAGNQSTSAPVGVTVDNLKGLVAAYSFDAGSGTTVADATIYGNSGTISGATWSSNGRFRGALSFDNGDLVSVPDSATLDLTGPMTIEAWLRPSSTNSWRTVAVKEGSSAIMYGLYANSRTSSGSNDGPSGNVFIGGTEVSSRATDRLLEDSWTHLAMTYDGAAVRVFEDGNLIASRSVAGAVGTSSGALRIGGNILRGEFYRGLIDELRIYRRALSSSEIRTDMTAPVGS